MDGAPPPNPLLQPTQPLSSYVQMVNPVDPQTQAEYALQREAEQRAAIAQRMGEVATRSVTTSQPF